MLLSDPKMALLIPTQLAFAVVATFLNAYITPAVLGNVIGNAKIGYFLGIIAAVATVVSVAAGWFIRKTDLRWPMMLMGAVAFASVVVPFIIEPDPGSFERNGVYKAVLLYAAQGVGRGIYESTGGTADPSPT